MEPEAQDPVCGQPVQRLGNLLTSEYAGVAYFFDSAECLTRFNAEPDLFTVGPAEGQIADHDRFLHVDQEAPTNQRVHAILEQPRVESGGG